jgi:hypothetical protein
LRCGGLDTVEGLVKNMLMVLTYIYPEQGGFDISKLTLQRTHEESVCILVRNILFFLFHFCCFVRLGMVVLVSIKKC